MKRLPLLPSKLVMVAGVMLRLAVPGGLSGGLRGELGVKRPSIGDSTSCPPRGHSGESGPLIVVADVGTIMEAYGPPGCTVGILAGPGLGLTISDSDASAKGPSSLG